MGEIREGTRCVIERRKYGSVDHRYESTVVRITPKRAYFNARTWFALDDPKREIKPRYLDYRTVVVEVLQPESDGDGG